VIEQDAGDLDAKDEFDRVTRPNCSHIGTTVQTVSNQTKLELIKNSVKKTLNNCELQRRRNKFNRSKAVECAPLSRMKCEVKAK
jgi:hypothetical protein